MLELRDFHRTKNYPQTAALRGFRDNPEKLKDTRTNIEIAIKELIAKGLNREDKGIEGLTKAAQIINRGKAGLTPHEGYLEAWKLKPVTEQDLFWTKHVKIISQ